MESFTSSLPPEQQPTVFTDHRVRYALCFSIVFFCLVVMVLDATLQSFWGDRFKRSNEKLMGGVEHARAVARDWEVRRRRRYLQALARLVISVLPILSLTTLLVYLMVSSPQTMLLYYLYVVGYGSVAFFQLNRCFTTSVERHMGGLYVAAVCGLTVGCVLRVLPPTRGWMYGDVVGMDTAAVLAWVFTCVSAWKDWDARGNKDQRGDIDGDPKTPIFIQRRYLSVTDEDSEDADDDQVNRGIHDPRMLSNITGHRVAAGDGSLLSMRISSLLNQCCANGDNYESSVAREAVRRSAQMWVSNLIHLVYSTTTAFADLRLEEICSFSTLDGNTGRLVITVGMLDATEAAADDWQPVLAILAVECILYHVSVAVFRHPYARALQAEHAAVAAATSRAANTPFARQLSQRLQLELARPTLPPLLSLALANSGARLLRRLCLTPVSVCWANFDYEWSTMPESVRAAIVCRVRGLPWSADSEMSGWLVDHGVDLDEWNWHAEIATTVVHMLEDRARALERNGVEVPRRRIGALLGEKDEAEQTSLYVGRHRQRSRMNPLGSIFAIPPTIVKWIAILSSASPDMERELWYLLSSPSWIAAALRTPLLFMLLTIHRFCRPLRDALIFIVLVCHHPRLKKLRRLATKGEIRKIRVGGTGDTRIMAEIGRRVVTGFAGVGAGGHEEVGKEQVGEVQSPLVLDIFDTTSMSLDMRPTNESAKPEASCRYDAQFRLRTRTDFSAAASGSRAGAVSTYHYLPESNGRWPVAKELRDAATRFLGYYDSAGRITHGTLTLGNSREYLFRYRYQETVKGKASGADGGEVLVAEYRRVSPLSSDADPAHRDTDSLTVVWGIPPLRPGGSGRRHVRSWVPSDRISRIVRVVSGQRYITTATYSHCRDPIISTVRIEANGSQTAVVNVPTVFAPDEAVLLTCPKGVSFDREDLLVRHSSRWVKKLFDAATKASSAASSSSPGVVVPPATKDGGGTIRRLLERLNPVSYVPSTWTGSAVYLRVPTWRLRTELWSLWLCRPKKGGAAATAIDGPTACWLDNVILRQEPLLAPYWRLRASGRLDRAREYLSANMDGIAAAIEPATDVSEVCLLAARPADLLAMGSSGRDANAITRRAEECVVRSDFSATAMAGPMPNQLSVAFNDLGCWPEAPGGVSNCRRDLVNNHSTIRNHVLAECANEYGLPCFQVERNVQSIKLLPMWGLDGPRTANHGLVENLLQSQVDGKVAATTTAGPMGIETTFVPLLKTFVRAARKAGKGLTRKEMNEASRAMRRMAAYFECCDYNVTWNSTAVERAWTEAWLEDLSQPLSSLSQSLAPRVKRGKEIHATQTARNVSSHRDRNTLSALASPSTPSPSDFHIALHIFAAYFFIFSVALPPPGAPCPLVFQATHHGISSLFGAVMKHWRGTTFGIWDHAILWRETCLNISPAQQSAGPGGLGLAVQAMLLAGVGLATKLAYWEADVVVPCTSEFNP